MKPDLEKLKVKYVWRTDAQGHPKEQKFTLSELSAEITRMCMSQEYTYNEVDRVIRQAVQNLLEQKEYELPNDKKTDEIRRESFNLAYTKSGNWRDFVDEKNEASPLILDVIDITIQKTAEAIFEDLESNKYGILHTPNEKNYQEYKKIKKKYLEDTS